MVITVAVIESGIRLAKRCETVHYEGKIATVRITVMVVVKVLIRTGKTTPVLGRKMVFFPRLL